MQDFVDGCARFGVSAGEDALDHVRRHLLDDVDDVVDEQLGHDAAQFRVGKAAQQPLLQIAVHFHEGLRRQLLRQQPEQKRDVAFLRAVQKQRDVLRRQPVQQRLDRAVVLGRKQFLELRGDFFIPHALSSFVQNV